MPNMTVIDIKNHARMAVLYTQKNMPKGASNIAQMQDAADKEDVINRVDTSRYVMGQIGKFLEGENQIESKMLLMQSCLSQNFKAGNCYEQAYCAYMYLKNKNVPNLFLAKVSMSGYGANDHHVFAIIGEDVTDDSRFWNLGKFVICDPWLSELAQKRKMNPEYCTGVYDDEDEYPEFLSALEVASDKVRINLMQENEIM